MVTHKSLYNIPTYSRDAKKSATSPQGKCQGLVSRFWAKKQVEELLLFPEIPENKDTVIKVFIFS